MFNVPVFVSWDFRPDFPASSASSWPGSAGTPASAAGSAHSGGGLWTWPGVPPATGDWSQPQTPWPCYVLQYHQAQSTKTLMV